jgi:hypothetical protein
MIILAFDTETTGIPVAVRTEKVRQIPGCFIVEHKTA